MKKMLLKLFWSALVAYNIWDIRTEHGWWALMEGTTIAFGLFLISDYEELDA